MATRAGILFILLVQTGAWSAPAADAVAQGQLRSIDSLANSFSAERISIRVRGVTTLVRRGTAYIQDQTGAMAVSLPESLRLAVGEEIEASGVYDGVYPYGRLISAEIRSLWSGSPPVAFAVQPHKAAEGVFAYRLVETEGRLLNSALTGRYLQLTLETSGQVFAATLELSTPVRHADRIRSGLEEGGWLRVRGVCAPAMSQDGVGASAFVILLRSTDDIRVVYSPPWWNLRNVAWLSLAAIVALILLHHARLRVLSQRFNAVVEERLRIAREMHDTLAQVFVGMTWQLEGLERKLPASAEMASARNQLSQALQLLRHSRDDAHSAIFALRSLAQSRPELLKLLESSSEAALANTGTEVVAISSGECRPLPDEVLGNLLRIGQEAVANAAKHAKASRITIRLRYDLDEVSLEIADNGRGFDPGTAGSPQDGHFGIQGMKERATRVQARLELDSVAGAGTTVTVRVPLSLSREVGARFVWARIQRFFAGIRRPAVSETSQ
jgi:signal transduction histidine kinase